MKRRITIIAIVAGALKLWGVGDGDATTNSSDPTRTDIGNIYMKGIHLELSRHWGTIQRSHGTIQGPFLDPYPGQTVWPAAGTSSTYTASSGGMLCTRRRTATFARAGRSIPCRRGGGTGEEMPQ